MRGHFQGRAIILSRRDIGEADRIIRVFFAERGRESVVARGVRKPQAKLRGMLEPGMEVQLNCVEAKSLPVLTGASLLAAHEAIITDYDTLIVAQGLLEITERTIAEHSPEVEWYDFLSSALTYLANHTGDDQTRRLIWSTGLIKNLQGHGLSPTLHLDRRHLHLQDGIFETSGGVELSEGAIKLWRVCRDYSVEDLARVKGLCVSLLELESVIARFWSLQTGIDQLKSYSLSGQNLI